MGWSGETYRKAKSVVDSGDEDAKAAMDSGEASVHKAYTQTRKTEEDKEEKRTWSFTVEFDSRKSIIALGRRIIEESPEDITIELGKMLLRAYGNVEVKQ